MVAALVEYKQGALEAQRRKRFIVPESLEGMEMKIEIGKMRKPIRQRWLKGIQTPERERQGALHVDST